MEKIDNLLVTVSPHLHSGNSTAGIMTAVILVLLPAGAWGVFIFGAYSLVVIMAAVLASVLTELIINRLLGTFTLNDGSAVLTGLLVGYNMPPSIPIYIPVVASIFAIAVVKHTFGGLGRNWMNPALAGRVFVMFSWTAPMTTWLVPKTWGLADAVTGASPLGFVKAGLFDLQSGTVTGPATFLASKGYPVTGLDTAVTGWLNGHHLEPIGATLTNGYVDLFVGNIPGCIGEVSALLLILGSVFLFLKKIITWEIPLTYLASFSLLIWIFGGLPFGNDFFKGDILFNFFSGGLILGALFMATDMATSPVTGRGMIIFGVGAGFLTFMIRTYGSFPEGVSLAIIIMNMFVPLIDRLTRPVKFGLVREGKA